MTPEFLSSIPRWPFAQPGNPMPLSGVWNHLGERAGPDSLLCTEREVREGRRLAAQSELQRLTR
ncbi:hypothetical protein GCM10008955_27470 [Deinococcus malanensis]|uniref:Uncharacterized protein n=1 Tax=Deinococcus malanensis TaxID=1706855 RepID=A0ABQ2EY65_9DEIO|nr:hypothetical protein [Deinococcus malanensis]GGK32111.1 hypothetical protein GCM10008955_27470 [Deinococcus malanensis]